jgi:hypothetical protein
LLNILFYFFANKTFNKSFIFFFTTAIILIFFFPQYLYPDFDSHNRNFKFVLSALFSGSEVVKSYSYGGKLQEHELFLDQLFLTPQLQIIRAVNFFFDLSIIQNENLYSFLLRFYFLFISSLIISFIILIDNFLINDKENNHINNFIFLISLMFPSILISITAPSSESVFSILIIFLFTRVLKKNLNLKQIIFYSIIYFYCFLLDSGNWILTFLYLINLIVCFLIINVNRTIFYIIFFLGISIIFLFVNDIINHLIELTDSNKLKRIVSDIQNTSTQYRDLIDILKRYIYLLLTLSTILLSDKQIIIISLFYNFYIFLIFSNGLFRNNYYALKMLDNFTIIQLLNLVFFTLVTVYVFPLHAFGKYYIFLIPVFFKILLNFINLNKLFTYNSLFIVLFLINVFLIYNI